MTLTVARYDGPPERWDSFVRAQSGWTHFHLHGWRDVMSGVLRHDTPYLAATTPAGDLAGVLPLVRVRSALFGHFLVSVPFLNYGGPLGGDDAMRALADAAVELAARGDADVLELRSRAPLPVELPVSHRKITVLLDLPAEGSDALWKRLDAKVRSQIRRPQKDGVTVSTGADQVAPFFAVFSEHMRDLGTPTLPRSFFQAIQDRFGSDVTFACAYLAGRPIACGCAVRWGDETEMTWASSLGAFNRISPNMLVYWEVMRQAADTGVRTFNFGRCTPGGGTHRFKRQWGGRDEPLWWYERRRPGASTPAEGKGAVGLGPRLWRRLPLPVATALGPRVVRFIP